jgi:hypothetical protein
VFCREDGTPLDRWHVRKEFAKITKAARLGPEWTPRELWHSFVSILSAHDVRPEDISDLERYLHPDDQSITDAGAALSARLSVRRSPDGPRLRVV